MYAVQLTGGKVVVLEGQLEGQSLIGCTGGCVNDGASTNVVPAVQTDARCRPLLITAATASEILYSAAPRTMTSPVTKCLRREESVANMTAVSVRHPCRCQKEIAYRNAPLSWAKLELDYNYSQIWQGNIFHNFTLALGFPLITCGHVMSSGRPAFSSFCLAFAALLKYVSPLVEF